MSRGIFYSTRSLTGREGKEIINHMKILETQSSSLDLLTCTRSPVYYNTISTQVNLKIDSWYNWYDTFYHAVAKNLSSWDKVYDELDVTYFSSYDKLYLIGGLDLWRSGLTRKGSRAEKFPYDSGQLKFTQTGIHLVNILAMLKANREYEIPFHEISFDPNEMAVNLFAIKPKTYTSYHGYDIPEYNIKRLDSLQYSFETSAILPAPIEKDVDFVFGYTVLKNSSRSSYVKDVNEIASSFSSSRLFVKNETTGEDSTIDRNIYLDNIARSRYTYMLPSYDVHCFSIYRFLWALEKDCLPLIHPSCNITDVQISYDVDLKCLIDFDRTENVRIEMLDYLKSKFLPYKIGFNLNA